MKNHNSVTQQELIRKIYIDDLIAAGVAIGQNGKSIHDMSDTELRYELALQSYRKIDITSDSQRWF